MLKFFCSICIDDKELHPDRIDIDNAYATCPSCGTNLIEGYARPKNPTDHTVTTEYYNELHGLDNQ